MKKNMIRKDYYVSSEQDKKLKKESEKTGLKEAEIVRRAIDLYFQKKEG